MRRCDDPRWREACQRVDRAASLLESTRQSVDPRVWEARDVWADAARAWLEGTGGISDAIEASLGFEDSATKATTAAFVRYLTPKTSGLRTDLAQYLD